MTRRDFPGFYQDPARAMAYEPHRARSVFRRISWAWEEARVARVLGGAGTGGHWLDLACGPGRTLRLLPPGSVAADISEAMLGLAAGRAAASGAWRVACDAVRLPFADNAFDGVLCLRFLHHLPEGARLAVLAEARRVARRWALVSFPTDRSLRAVMRRLRGRPLGPRRSVSDIAREAEAGGWTTRRVMGIFPPFSETTLALLERQRFE